MFVQPKYLHLLHHWLIYSRPLPHAKVVTILSLRNRPSEWISGQACLPSVSMVETFIFAVLLHVIIWRTINGTSDSSSEYSCCCRHLHTRSSVRSTLDSLSESLESTGAANTIFRNDLSVVVISYSSIDAARRCLACVFVTEPVNWSPILFDNHVI